MKIRTKELPYSEVMKIKPTLHIKPVRQNPFFRHTLKVLSAPDLMSVRFKLTKEGMDRLGKKEPALFLMNHSSFTDLEIAFTLLANREYHIICTNDGLIGKTGTLMRAGCIPAKKFISDMYMVKDMKYAVDKLNSSILMYPEASYSFDGCETPLPDSLGKLLKLLNIPVIMIRTKGSFLRDPLYNCLQKRKVPVSAHMYYLLSPEDIKQKSTDELNAIVSGAFEINNFKEQFEAGIEVDEPFRADGLHRVLYKCPDCMTEGAMKGEGIHITCACCGAEYELTTLGKLQRVDAEGNPDTDKKTPFEYVPEWYNWERKCVRKEIEDGTYRMDEEVGICMMVDFDALYKVGKGRLIHDADGFTLTGCDGQLEYHQSTESSYSLYADYYWYEIGDMICIGDASKQFYCFPEDKEKALVAKARLATEELFTLKKH